MIRIIGLPAKEFVVNTIFINNYLSAKQNHASVSEYGGRRAFGEFTPKPIILFVEIVQG